MISSYEYYQAGRDHLTPGGIMMQWVPFGAPEEDFKDHLRTFASVFPHVTVIRGPGGYGAYMLGSEQPMTFDADAIREVLSRAGHPRGHLVRLRLAGDDVDDWVEVIDAQHWLDEPRPPAYAGPGRSSPTTIRVPSTS